MESFEITNALRSRMGPREDLLWSGTPKTGVFLQAQDAVLIPFSLFWCGFAVFWEVMALRGTSAGPEPFGPVAIFPLFGLPFIVIGLYLVAGRFFFDAYRRARTIYGVSNERVIILRNLWSENMTSVPLDQLPQTTLTEYRDGTGSIQFGEALPAFYARRGGVWPGAATNSFERIPDAKTVDDLIRERARKLRVPS